MKNKFEVLSLTRQLMEISSISGDEAALADFLEHRLAQSGFVVERQRVSDQRDNIWARPSRNEVPVLAFNSHMDTVPPYLPFSEDDEWIYGRGACDTKGAMAAQILAGERLLSEGVKNIGFLFVVGEETDHSGAIASENGPWLPHAVIVAEPTERRFASSQKGMLRLRLTSRGQAGHSGYPESGRSAWSALLKSLYRIESENWPENPVFGKTTVNAGKVSAPNAANVISDYAEAELVIRVSGQVESTLDRVRELLEPGIEVELIVTSNPVQLDTLPLFPAEPVAFHTDLPYFKNVTRKYLWGVGSILDAHTRNEKVRKSDLVAAVDDYYQMALEILRQLR